MTMTHRPSFLAYYLSLMAGQPTAITWLFPQKEAARLTELGFDLEAPQIRNFVRVYPDPAPAAPPAPPLAPLDHQETPGPKTSAGPYLASLATSLKSCPAPAHPAMAPILLLSILAASLAFHAARRSPVNL